MFSWVSSLNHQYNINQLQSQQIYLTDMQLSDNGKRNKRWHLKTLCTLDTNDINLTDSLLYTKTDKCYKTDQKSLNKTKNSKKPSQKKHNRSLTPGPVYNNSCFDNTTLKSKFMRSANVFSKDRIYFNTEYSEAHISNIKHKFNSTCKKLVYPLDNNYKLDTYELIRSLKGSRKEQKSLVKDIFRKNRNYLMIRTTDRKLMRYYQRQMRFKNEVVEHLQYKDRKLFHCPVKVYKENNCITVLKENLLKLSWTDSSHQFVLGQFKNDEKALRGFVKGAARMVLALSNSGCVHGDLSIQSFYFKQDKKGVRILKKKLGGLGHYFPIQNKQKLLQMSFSYRTPPEVINFMLFQQKGKFQRQLLDHIQILKEGWKIDVWALGVLALQLLNCGPLIYNYAQQDLLTLQLQLALRYSHLFFDVSQQFRLLILKMISPNPVDRPHPNYIISQL